MDEKEKFVFGLSGIAELLQCSASTALRLKKTTLAPAVIQVGRNIIVNREQALELMKNRVRDGRGRKLRKK